MKELLAIFACMGIGWLVSTSVSRPISKPIEDDSIAVSEDQAFELNYTRAFYRNAN